VAVTERPVRTVTDRSVAAAVGGGVGRRSRCPGGAMGAHGWSGTPDRAAGTFIPRAEGVSA